MDNRLKDRPVVAPTLSIAGLNSLIARLMLSATAAELLLCSQSVVLVAHFRSIHCSLSRDSMQALIQLKSSAAALNLSSRAITRQWARQA